MPIHQSSAMHFMHLFCCLHMLVHDAMLTNTHSRRPHEGFSRMTAVVGALLESRVLHAGVVRCTAAHGPSA